MQKKMTDFTDKGEAASYVLAFLSGYLQCGINKFNHDKIRDTINEYLNVHTHLALIPNRGEA